MFLLMFGEEIVNSSYRPFQNLSLTINHVAKVVYTTPNVLSRSPHPRPLSTTVRGVPS
jgi:hypothetical protein